MTTADALRYIFGVWLLLILSAAVLWRRTGDLPGPGEPADPAAPADGGG